MQNETSPLDTERKITLRGKEFTLFYPLEALWKYEDETGVSLIGDDSGTKEQLEAELKTLTRRQRIERTVALLWAGLITYHPDLTLQAVSKMVLPKDMPYVEATVAEAYKASWPELPSEESGDPLAQNASA